MQPENLWTDSEKYAKSAFTIKKNQGPKSW